MSPYVPSPVKIWTIDETSKFKPDLGLPRDVILSCTPEVERAIRWAAAESVAQRTPPWYAIRNELDFTGSIADTVMGRNKYKVDRATGINYGWIDTALDKLGRNPDPFCGNEATRFGTEHESTCFERTMQYLNCHCFEIGLLRHPSPEWAFCGGSADGVAAHGYLCEFKVPFRRKFKKGDPIPPQYYHQPQFYMWLLNLHKGIYAEFKPKRSHWDTELLNVVSVPREDTAISNMLDTAKAFSAELTQIRKTGVMPPAMHARMMQIIEQRAHASRTAFERTTGINGMPLIDAAHNMPEFRERWFQPLRADHYPPHVDVSRLIERSQCLLSGATGKQ